MSEHATPPWSSTVPSRSLTRGPSNSRLCGVTDAMMVALGAVATAGLVFALSRARARAGEREKEGEQRQPVRDNGICSTSSGSLPRPAPGDGGTSEYTPPWCSSTPSSLPPLCPEQQALLRKLAPAHRLRLAHLPTPLHRWDVASSAEVWIKRDDCTGGEVSGNKIRKLEFLLADALDKGCDSVITVGGIQSNHCRATAAAAAWVGLQSHVILRTSQSVSALSPCRTLRVRASTGGGGGDATQNLCPSDPGLVGNLLVSRMVGACLHLVSEEEYARKGGWGLVCELKGILENTANGSVKGTTDAKQGHSHKSDSPTRNFTSRRPYGFPSGGSCALGVWGYVEAVAEIQRQTIASGVEIDRIYFACGSGGTAAGLSLGLHLSEMAQCRRESGGSPGANRHRIELVGLCVDDSPDYFYDKIEQLFVDMGIRAPCPSPLLDVSVSARQLLRLEDCVGLGYAVASDGELEGIASIARATGVVLDPAYTGKAALAMLRDLEQSNGRTKKQGGDDARGQGALRVLFLHTGGLLGLFDKTDQLLPILSQGTD